MPWSPYPRERRCPAPRNRPCWPPCPPTPPTRCCGRHWPIAARKPATPPGNCSVCICGCGRSGAAPSERRGRSGWGSCCWPECGTTCPDSPTAWGWSSPSSRRAIFLMGSPESEEEREEDERQHAVELTRAFWAGVHPVTQQQYQAVTGENPSYFQAAGEGKDGQWRGWTRVGFPVEQVSWEEATAFCTRLTQREETLSERVYRLPSEAQWEYLCRGGAPASHPFCFGPSLRSSQANFNGNYPYGGAEKGPYLERTSAVGSYRANGFGLHDVHGNVWEWCLDWYAKSRVRKCVQRDPSGPSEGSHRVIRGGSWVATARSAGRRTAPGRPDGPVREPGLSCRPCSVRRVRQERSGAGTRS